MEFNESIFKQTTWQIALQAMRCDNFLSFGLKVELSGDK